MNPIALIIVGLGMNGQLLFTEKANGYLDYNTCLNAITDYDARLTWAVKRGMLRVNGEVVAKIQFSCQEKKS